MSVGKIWGIAVLSDLPQLHLDRILSHFKKRISNAITEVEKNDALVERIDIFRKSDSLITIEAFPAKEYLSRCSSPPQKVHSCPECGTPFEDAGDHPENGCLFGIVENVLRQ